MRENNKRLTLRKKTVGPWSMNTYALICPETTDSVLIDPGAEPEALEDMLSKSRPTAILLTHSHPDHIGALSEMQSKLDVPVYAHKAMALHETGVSVDKPLHDRDVITLGNHGLQVFYTPGHSEDQVSFFLLSDDRAIVGDTIFEGGPGKTWSAEGFQETLMTLENVILDWPDDTVCYPGHGPQFRLGDYRSDIKAFIEKDHGNFYGDATWDM